MGQGGVPSERGKLLDASAGIRKILAMSLHIQRFAIFKRKCSAVNTMFPYQPVESDTTPYFQDVVVGKFREDVDDKPCLCFHPSQQNKEYQLLVIEATA